jgi:long-chain acyl-CoA synthetase
LTVKAHIWDPWKSAGAEPDRMAVATDDGHHITYRQLVAQADMIGSTLTAMGLPDGTRLSTDLRSGPEFFSVALAAAKYGFGLFPVNAALVRSGKAGALCRAAGTALHVTHEPAAFDGPAIGYDELAAGGRSGSAAAARAGYWIFATSGTTSGEHDVVGQPRPRRPYQGVAVFERHSAGRGFGPHIMGNPSFHLGTLGPAMHALQAGSGVVVAHRWSPEHLSNLVREHSAASAFLGVDQLTEYALSPERRCGLKTLFHGGSACAPWVKRKAMDVHGPILHEYYGTSEGVISEISSADWVRHPGSVGRPFPGLDIVITRDGAPVPAGTAGEVSIQTRPTDGTARPIRSTGDLGYLDPDGYLHVLGRVAGANGTVEALVEHRVRAVEGVRDVVVLDDSDVTCLVEATPDETAGLAPTIAGVIEGAGARPREILILPPRTLERTSSGKLSRVAARRFAEARRNPSDEVSEQTI